jgi:hypothetical protein
MSCWAHGEQTTASILALFLTVLLHPFYLYCIPSPTLPLFFLLSLAQSTSTVYLPLPLPLALPLYLTLSNALSSLYPSLYSFLYSSLLSSFYTSPPISHLPFLSLFPLLSLRLTLFTASYFRFLQ